MQMILYKSKVRKAQTGDKFNFVSPGTSEYSKALSEGTFADKTNELSGIEITAKRDKNIPDRYPFVDKLSSQELKYLHKPGAIGRGVRAKATDGVGVTMDTARDMVTNWLTKIPVAAIQLPQSATVEGIEALRGNKFNFADAGTPGRQRLPSQTMGYTKPDGFLQHAANFGLDAVVDPTNLVGAGIISKGVKFKQLPRLVNSAFNPLSGVSGLVNKVGNKYLPKAYKLNPNAVKEVPFKSDIDWAKWNKEIPENKALMQEYNAIEQKAKANGSWMKNPDGSKFKGAKEQFVQQNSENFKKFYVSSKVKGDHGEVLKMYHGSPNKTITSFKVPGEDGYVKSATTTTGDSGIYFSDKKEYADLYRDFQFKDKRSLGKTYETYLAPRTAITAGENASVGGLPSSFLWNHGKVPVDAVKGGKYMRKSYPAAGLEVAMENPNLIKSATGNNGMFDMTNPNIYNGIDGNFITKPLTPFTKNELTPGTQLYRKIGGKRGLLDLISKKGAQAPGPMRMKSGQMLDTPFFGTGKAPNESYSGIFAVEHSPESMSKYKWSNQVGGTSNYGVAPIDPSTGRPIKNIPLEDLQVYRKKWFSNNYKKLDKNNLDKGLKHANLQQGAETVFKWGARAYIADQVINDGDNTGGPIMKVINNIKKSNK